MFHEICANFAVKDGVGERSFNMKKKVLLFLALAALVAGGVFAQTNTRVRASDFNGGYSGGVTNSDNPLESLVSTTNAIRLSGTAVRGSGIAGGTLSIPARIQGGGDPITYDGYAVGTWFYLYSSGTKIGVAAYLQSGDYFLFFGAAAVRDGLEGATLSGYSASGMGTTYEGTLVKGSR
jgi:hypothetical protein